MQQREVAAGGLTFDAFDTGPAEGRAVLFLHGFPQTWYSWHHQLEAVSAAGYRGLAFDQRGYSPGARPPAVEDYRIAELVGDVLTVADHFGLDRFDLVGHDWGAMVAWVVAGRHPDRVRTLTAVSVPHPRAFAAAFGGGGEGAAGDAGGDDDQRQRSSYIEVFRAEGGWPSVPCSVRTDRARDSWPCSTPAGSLRTATRYAGSSPRWSSPGP